MADLWEGTKTVIRLSSCDAMHGKIPSSFILFMSHKISTSGRWQEKLNTRRCIFTISLIFQIFGNYNHDNQLYRKIKRGALRSTRPDDPKNCFACPILLRSTGKIILGLTLQDSWICICICIKTSLRASKIRYQGEIQVGSD